MRALIAPVRHRIRAVVALTVASCCLVVAGLASVGIVATRMLETGSGPVVAELATTAALLLAGFVMRLGADVEAHRADADLAYAIRQRLADALDRAPFPWFARHPPGELRRVLVDEVATMHHIVAHSYADLTAAIATPVLSAVAIAAIDPRLLLVLAAPVALAVLIARWMGRFNAQKMPEYGAVAAGMSAEITEFLSGMPVMKAFGHEGSATARLRSADAAFVTFFLSWARPLIRPETLAAQLVAPATLLALAMLGGIASASAGWTEASALVPVLLLGLGVSTPLSAIGDNTRALGMARRAARQILELLDAPAEDHRGAAPFPARAGVELRRVGYATGGVTVLDDVSLVLPEGALVAVVGPSGAGKSTLARLITGLLEPTTGEILVGGEPLPTIDLGARRRAIGYVGQSTHLLRATVTTNVALTEGPADPARVTAATGTAAAHGFISALPRGLATVIGEDTVLSGGQQQRLALARVAYTDRRLLVLDEPMSGVDLETEAAVQAGISSLLRAQRERGVAPTVLVIAHRLETIVAADMVVVLEGGRVAQQGTHAELLAREGTYRRLWRAQRLDFASAP